MSSAVHVSYSDPPIVMQLAVTRISNLTQGPIISHITNTGEIISNPALFKSQQNYLRINYFATCRF